MACAQQADTWGGLDASTRPFFQALVDEYDAADLGDDALGTRLRELATRAGVSAAYLSRLENGHLSPTVSTLTRIMRAMGEPVSNAFGDRDLTGPVVRVSDRRVIRERGVDDYMLSPTRSGRLEVLETVIQPGGGSGDAYSHPGNEECVIVLHGAFRMWVDGSKYDLTPGDAQGSVASRSRSMRRFQDAICGVT